MVLTGPQVIAFFTGPTQMAIPAATIPALNNEGIDGPGDLAEFDEKGITQVVESLRKPGDRIPHPDHEAADGVTIPRPPYVLGAKSQKRLTAASDLIRYYETTGRTLTPGNIQWDPIIKDFVQQYKALTARKDEEITVPKLSRGLPMLKWVEAFNDFLARKVGARHIPLSYVVRETVEVPAQAPPLANNKPHSTEHGSIEMELVARASHDHPLFREDNSKVYFFLEESLRGTNYAPSLKPYQREKDGRGAMLGVTGQYAGIDKWEAELHRQDEFVHNRVWKGQSNFPLEKFIAQHRNAFVSMTQCATHVQFQLPNEYTRVGYLINNIHTSDPKLQAAIAVVESDTNDGGKRNDFESAASYILPKDPVAARLLSRKQKGGGADVAAADANADAAAISAINAASDYGAKIGRTQNAVRATQKEISAFGTKVGRGQTGVHLRYYKKAEYNKLSSEQKDELREWRKQEVAKQEQKGSHNKGSVGATIAKEISKQLNAMKSEAVGAEKDKKEMESFILSVVDKRQLSDPSYANSRKKVRISEVNADETPTPPSSTLQSILRRVKNG